ncbi:glutamine-rich protein 2 isoform X1 [Micropterus dolomieu]|uniref:glutamine-rich protein 2 isoform X1 n=2 Tax=Micropterus dolomieu TaxID=147949 RepID=UPI001E8EB25E|nr:glutamine-rich protein 2 isoform X1 [Micropterus dolomieu]
MSEENISLYELLNLSIGTQRGAVNFGALHALLHAVLKQLDIREMETRWRDTPPGVGHPDAPVVVVVGVTEQRQQRAEEEEHRVQRDISPVEKDVRSGTELQAERTASPSSPTPSSGPAADSQWRLRSRIQTCEDDVSKAMQLIQELHNQKDSLKEEIKELRHQQKMTGVEAETVTAVEKCCLRVDALEETVRTLRATFPKDPGPDQLSQCVTWDVMQSTLLSEKEDLQEELVNSGLVGPAPVLKPTNTPVNSDLPAVHAAPPHTSTPSSSSSHPVEDTGRPAAPSSPPRPPAIPGQISPLREVTDARPDTEAPSVPSLKAPQTHPKAAAVTPLSRHASGSERYPETVEALRNIGKLKERFNKLEARVAALEEVKLDQSQLTHLRELVTKGSWEVSNNLLDQLNQQRALIDSLMSGREKLDNLEDMFMNLASHGSETEAAPGSADSDSFASRVLRQQISFLRKSVQKLEDDLKQLKAEQALTVKETTTTDPHLQDQLDDLRGMLEDMMLSLTSQLSSSLQDEAGQDEAGQDQSDSQGFGQRTERSAFTTSTVNIGRKLSCLFQHYEQLQDTVNILLQQHTGGRAGALKDIEDVQLVNDVQKAILQLQAECGKLHETTRCLLEDNRQKQSHIEELYKTTEELEGKKADKHMVENEIKADKSALESKVSRLQFDSVTEQLNAMFHELLNKVTGQEQDWHKVVDKLSTEMECKMNRIELDSVKRQLEGRWRNIHEKLQAQGAPEHEDAAGLRKQLVDRFHCLSCDRPVVKYTPGPHPVKLPSSPGFPSHKSIRPFTVYALEQFRQHYRSLKPGTNRYNFEVANPGRRREQLQKSHAVMCRQIESVQRRLKRRDRAGGCDATSDSLIQNQPGVLHERGSETTADGSHLAMTRSCGGSHTVTYASQRRAGMQYMKHYTQTEGDGLIPSEEVDIVGLDGHIYKGRLNAAAMRNTDTKLPIIPTKDAESWKCRGERESALMAAGMCKTKDKAKCSLPHKPAGSPEMGHSAPAHHPPSAKSVQCSRSASSSSGRDWPVSALGCTSQSSLTPASAAADTERQANEPLNL